MFFGLDMAGAGFCSDYSPVNLSFRPIYGIVPPAQYVGSRCGGRLRTIGMRLNNVHENFRRDLPPDSARTRVFAETMGSMAEFLVVAPPIMAARPDLRAVCTDVLGPHERIDGRKEACRTFCPSRSASCECRIRPGHHRRGLDDGNLGF